jgi:hypothetical protein
MNVGLCEVTQVLEELFCVCIYIYIYILHTHVYIYIYKLHVKRNILSNCDWLNRRVYLCSA